MRSTRAPRSWTGWSRSRSAASRSRRAATTCKWRDSLDQHHRHPRPRRLHRRGGAVAARPRRRGRGVRRGRRRRAADRDGVAPGQQVQRPAHVLRQQDGPRRRRLLPLPRHDQGPPRRRRRGRAAADRRRERVPRRHRPARDEGAGLGRRHGRGATRPSTSRPTLRRRRRDVAPRARRRRVSQYDENVLEKYVGEEEITADDLRTALRARHHRRRVVPVLCGTAFKNKGVQPLLDAVVDYLPSPLDVPADRGHSTCKTERARWSARPTTASRSRRSRSRS